MTPIETVALLAFEAIQAREQAILDLQSRLDAAEARIRELSAPQD